MRKALPANPNLNYLRQEAKELKRSLDQKNYSDSYRIAEHLSTYQLGDLVSLSDAQFVIAREYGFASWSKLKRAIENPQQVAPADKKKSDRNPMLERVNITCGDIASTMLKNCGIAGQRLPLKDLLCIGPLPDCADYHAFFRKRAEFIKAWTRLEGLPDAEKMARKEQQSLRNTLSAKAIVFWVWPHLSNQLLLLFLLDWYQKNNYDGELLWVDASREANRNDEAYVKSLINTETTITPSQLSYANDLWCALRKNTPEKLISTLKKQTEYFPAINDALWRYAEELPNINTGLSRQQHLVLEAVQSGCHNPHAIFKYVHQDEQYFIVGDWYLWHVIAGMIDVEFPLIRTREGMPFFYPPLNMSDNFGQQSLFITEIGRQVFEGEKCHVNLNGIERAWGGLELNQCSSWRYDPKAKTIRLID